MNFISPGDILKHLYEYLPRITDNFSDKLNVSGEILTGDPQTLRITQAAHGYVTGKKVQFVGSLIDNDITAVSQVIDALSGESILTFTTALPHDLTLEEGATVSLDGFTDSGLNVNFTLESVTSRTTFSIVYLTLPTLNGAEVQYASWSNGLDNVFVITFVDINTYDILLTGKPEFQLGTIRNIDIITNRRMAIATDFARAQAIYTAQGNDDLWLFVIMEDASASKDRMVSSDASQTNTNGQTSRVRMVNRFTIDVFFPAKNDLSGAVASQRAWVEIYLEMLAVASGMKFDDFGNSDFITALIGHGSALYNNANYVHGYTFEYAYDYTASQNFLNEFIVTRAYRDTGISLTELSDGSNVDMDGGS